MGNGGLKGTGNGGPVKEPDSERPPVLEEWGSEDEVQASVSGGVGGPIYSPEALERLKAVIGDPGRKRWWEPFVDVNDEPITPIPQPDAAIMDALARDAKGTLFLDNLIEADSVSLPRNMRLWPHAMKAYELLSAQYLELLRTKKSDYLQMHAFGDQSDGLVAQKLAMLLIYAVGRNHL